MIVERVAGTCAASASTAAPANNTLNAVEVFPAPGKGYNQRLVSPNGGFTFVPGTHGNSGMFCTLKSDTAKLFAAWMKTQRPA